MPLFGRHRRLPSMDKENEGDLGGNGYTSVCGDFSFASSSVGLSVNQQNVILKLESTSPLANKFRVGDVIVQVRRRHDSSTLFSCDSTNECRIRLPLTPGEWKRLHEHECGCAAGGRGAREPHCTAQGQQPRQDAI